jgi:hypothetical protein
VFEGDFSYQTYGEDQESIRGLEVELESENVENCRRASAISSIVTAMFEMLVVCRTGMLLSTSNWLAFKVVLEAKASLRGLKIVERLC